MNMEKKKLKVTCTVGSIYASITSQVNTCCVGCKVGMGITAGTLIIAWPSVNTNVFTSMSVFNTHINCITGSAINIISSCTNTSILHRISIEVIGGPIKSQIS
jgi:hypothetical protein